MKNWWIKYRAWCQKERVGRVEEGTSQDMCPTNGDSLFFGFLMFLVSVLIGAAILFERV